MRTFEKNILTFSIFNENNILIKDLISTPPEKLIAVAKSMRHMELSDGSSWVMPEVGFAPVVDNVVLKKNYIVHGVKRRSSSINTSRVDHIYQDPHEKNYKFRLHYGDITDSTSVSKIIYSTKPDEIYNLAAQSHVAVSFEVPEYTANADGLGALRILEAIKFHRLEKKTKFYQAGTSEMFGRVRETPQSENTPFYPRSPYEKMDGWVHLPRLIDKIRLQKAGQLHEDYQPNYLNKGFDLAWFEASGITPEALIEVVTNSITDGQISDWIKANVNKSDSEKKTLQNNLLSYGTHGVLLEKLIQRKAESGLQDRHDIQCMFQYIDADEGRI